MRVLFTVWPFAGCVNPNIAVARALAARGHQTAFYTGKAYRSQLESLGFEHFPFKRLDESVIDRLVHSADSIGVNWDKPWKLRPRLRELFLDTVPMQMADIERIRREWRPDVIVTDPALWATFLLLAELDPIPVAILSYAGGCMLPGPDVPPVGLGLPRPRNAWQRLRNRLVGAGQDVFLRSVRRAASRLRKNHGLGPIKGPVIELAARLPLYLLPSCPEYDYNRRDLPSCVEYVGPLQWYPDAPAPAWLDELDPGLPLIHATEGTLHVRSPFVLRTAAEALGSLPMEVVLTSGDRNPSRLGLGALAPNVRLVEWVNHDQLLARSSVLITTAGGGTVMAGLAAGVPMVLVPTEWDKAENAQRVVEAGAGIRIEPRQCTPHRLRAAVERILGEPAFRANARRLAEALARRGGPERAADLLEELAPPGAPARRARGLLTVDDALALDATRTSALHKNYLNPRLARLMEIVGAAEPAVRASGSLYWDRHGREYLDFLSAFGALCLGHNPAAVEEAVARVSALPNLSDGLSPLAGVLAHNLAAIAPQGLTRAHLANSGTEVVDAAIKFARAATGRPRIAACHESFHGRSIGALSCTDHASNREAFEPLLQGTSIIPFGDIAALDAVLRGRDVAGFLVEPIQGEAGMLLPPPGYLAEARKLCTRHGTLLIADEIQTGLGRTGRMFAVDHENVVPDALLLGKALGAGVMPVSALLTTDKLYRQARSGGPRSAFHESTYAGNTRACAAAIAAVNAIVSRRLDQAAAEAGSYLVGRLRDLHLRQPLIGSVRGRGLMVGVELAEPTRGLATLLTGGVPNALAREFFGGMVMRDLLTRHSVMTCFALNHPRVLRLQPALTVTREQIDRAVDALDQTLVRIGSFPRAARLSWQVLSEVRNA